MERLKSILSFAGGMAVVAAFIFLGGWIAERPWAGIILLGMMVTSFLGILIVLCLILPRTPRS
jgi:hypothetical protein